MHTRRARRASKQLSGSLPDIVQPLGHNQAGSSVSSCHPRLRFSGVNSKDPIKCVLKPWILIKEKNLNYLKISPKEVGL